MFIEWEMSGIVKGKFAAVMVIEMVLLSSCSSYKIYNLKDARNVDIQHNGVVYALPKTVLRIEMEVTMQELKPGPYAAYAAKYLGISNVPRTDSVVWFISDIHIESYSEPDPDHYYCVESDKSVVSDMINLSKQGLIVAINGNADYSETDSKTDLFLNQVFNKPIELSQLPVMDAQTERIDTTYRTIFTDSTFMRIPVMRKQQVNKSLEEKAEEIAGLILELREEKVALLTGDINEFPDGEALSIILHEFKEIEEQYLPLFTGSRSEQVIKAVYEFTPTSENQKSKNILFRFSPQNGILSNTDLSGIPVLVEVENQDYTTNFGDFIQYKDSLLENAGGLYFRIPDKAIVRIVQDDKVIATKKLQVAQYGKIDALPLSLLKSSKRVEFYPETGALKGISQ